MRKVSKTRKFKAFICSYSGTIALLGVLLLVCQILFSMYLQGSSTYGEIEKITSPIVMSFVASVIFYFISFYLPKVRINEINSKEIEEFFRRLEHLNTYTLISLGLGASRFYKEGIFKYPTLEAVKMVSEGQTIHDKPDIDCWEEDEIYEKLKNSKDWLEYFGVIVDEELSLLDAISSKVDLHPDVKKEIYNLKGFVSLYHKLQIIKELEKMPLSEEQRKQYQQLSSLIMSFCMHVDNTVKLENAYCDSIYQPL